MTITVENSARLMAGAALMALATAATLPANAQEAQTLKVTHLFNPTV